MLWSGGNQCYGTALGPGRCHCRAEAGSGWVAGLADLGLLVGGLSRSQAQADRALATRCSAWKVHLGPGRGIGVHSQTLHVLKS